MFWVYINIVPISSIYKPYIIIISFLVTSYICVAMDFKNWFGKKRFCSSKLVASVWNSAKSGRNYRPPQWRNRLAHGTYRQYALRHAGVVSSSLTWGRNIFIFNNTFLKRHIFHQNMVFNHINAKINKDIYYLYIK